MDSAGSMLTSLLRSVRHVVVNRLQGANVVDQASVERVVVGCQNDFGPEMEWRLFQEETPWPRPIPRLNIFVSLRSCSGWHGVGDQNPGKGTQLCEHPKNVSIAEVLQNLADQNEIAGRQWIGNGINALESNLGETSMNFPVVMDELRDDIRSNIRDHRIRRDQLPANAKVAATDVNYRPDIVSAYQVRDEANIRSSDLGIGAWSRVEALASDLRLPPDSAAVGLAEPAAPRQN